MNNINQDDLSINIFDLFKALWQGKYIVILFVLLSVMLASFYLRFSEPQYTVYLQVVPAEKKEGSATNSLLQSYGGVAELVGISMPSFGGNGNFEHFKEIFKSRSVYEKLVNDYELMKVLFGEEWDKKLNNTWKPNPPKTSDKIKNFIKYTLGIRSYPKTPPGIEEVERIFNNMVSISTDRKGIITTLSIEISDPGLGKKIIKEMHKAADDILRHRSAIQTEVYIEYINKKISESQLKEHRQALIKTLSEQQKILMMSNAGNFFAAEPFSSIVSSSTPTFPYPKTVLVLFSSSGFLFGCIFVIIYSFTKKQFFDRQN